MKKVLFFIPAVIAILFYIVLGIGGGFGAISVWVWFGIAMMILSAVLMNKEKWYGCIGGLFVGGFLIYLSTRYTGQVIEIERPLGMLLCVFYLMCGYSIYKTNKMSQ